MESTRCLKRDERVFLNRLETEYSQRELPEKDRIQFDIAKLLVLIKRLNDGLRRRAGDL